jgi:hypothetical protein
MITTAVLVKGELTGIISRARLGDGFLLVSKDSRRRPPHAEREYDREMAARRLKAAIAKSRRRGWRVIYAGPVLRG